MADKEVNIAGIMELLEVFRGTNEKDHERIIKLLEKQNGRIKKNENWKFLITGIALGAGLVSGVGGSALFRFLI